MKRSGQRLLYVTVLCLCFMMATAFAETDQWKSRSYDFDRINTILVVGPNIAPTVDNPYASLKASEMLTDYLLKKKFKYIDVQQFKTSIAADIGISVEELEKKDLPEIQRIFAEKAPKYVQAIFVVDVFAYGWTKEKVEGYYQGRQTTQTGSATGFIGTRPVSGTYSGPVTTYSYVPGGEMQIANGGCMFSLFDAKTFKLVWSTMIVRSKDSRAVGFLGANFGINRFVKNKPNIDNMLNEIICDGIDKLPLKNND